MAVAITPRICGAVCTADAKNPKNKDMEIVKRGFRMTVLFKIKSPTAGVGPPAGSDEQSNAVTAQ